MTIFQYHITTQKQEESEIREWSTENGDSFLLAVSGKRADVLVNSSKWDEIRNSSTYSENTGSAIEAICRAFIERYRQSDAGKPPTSANEIIRSIGLIRLRRDGSGFLYRAGQCTFSTVTHRGFVKPYGAANSISDFQLVENQSMILDLNGAEIDGLILSELLKVNPEEASPTTFRQFNYPFAFIRSYTAKVADEQPLPVAAPDITPAGIPEITEETIETETEPATEAVSTSPPERSESTALSESKTGEMSAEKQEEIRMWLREQMAVKKTADARKETDKLKPSAPKKFPAGATVFVALIVLLAVGFWMVRDDIFSAQAPPQQTSGTEPDPDSTLGSEPDLEQNAQKQLPTPPYTDTARDSQQIVEKQNAENPPKENAGGEPETERQVAETQDSDGAKDLSIAETSLKEADQYLRDGENQNALEALNTAQKHFVKYIKTRPQDADRAREKLNEVQAKRRIILNSI